jgi:hypothetical protein
MRTTAGAATDAIEEAKNVRRAMRIKECPGGDSRRRLYLIEA